MPTKFCIRKLEKYWKQSDLLPSVESLLLLKEEKTDKRGGGATARQSEGIQVQILMCGLKNSRTQTKTKPGETHRGFQGDTKTITRRDGKKSEEWKQGWDCLLERPQGTRQGVGKTLAWASV